MKKMCQQLCINTGDTERELLYISGSQGGVYEA